MHTDSQSPNKIKPVLAGNTALLFASPVHCVKYEDVDEFNAEVAAFILQQRDAGQTSDHRSNVGGWHSSVKLLQELGPRLGGRLTEMFLRGVHGLLSDLVDVKEPWPGRSGIEAWSIVNEAGHYNQAHVHPGSTWSGAYYVATDQDAGGEIVFSDPRMEAVMNRHPLSPFSDNSRINYKPAPGMLLVFPSFLTHGVVIYRGKNPRIVISFNLF